MNSDLLSAPTLEALYQGLAPLSVGAGWAKPTPSLWPEPHKTFKPAQWRWTDGKAALTAAGRLVNTELAERRNLILFNPLEGNTYATVRTMICAYQSVLPGETTRSHRHSPNALRFILEGEGSYTIVDGQKLYMHPNDVLLTPNWAWHGHGCDGDDACFWLDCLDVPTTQMLEPMFFEPYPGWIEDATSTPVESPFIFPWDKVQAALDHETPDPDGFRGRVTQLGNPALVTIALHMERMESGFRSRPYRTTANRIFCCAEGSGVTIVDGERFAWKRGDVVAAPAWRHVEHHVDHDATLFCMSDEPLMQMLGWLRVDKSAA
jgi:gentisate 1,2-dioxygenase